MSIAAALLLAYAAAGAVVAVGFAAYGVTRLLGEPVTVTPGARLLLLPGALLLWPLIVRRWMTLRSREEAR